MQERINPTRSSVRPRQKWYYFPIHRHRRNTPALDFACMRKKIPVGAVSACDCAFSIPFRKRPGRAQKRLKSTRRALDPSRCSQSSSKVGDSVRNPENLRCFRHGNRQSLQKSRDFQLEEKFVVGSAVTLSLFACSHDITFSNLRDV